MRGLLVVGLLIAMGCQQEKSYAINEQEAVDILTDLLIADELLVKYGSKNKEVYRDSLKFQILRKYDLTEAEFDSTLVNLQMDLKYYNGIQKKVSQRLKEALNENEQ